MLIDGVDVAGRTLDTDVCIVGAGPAGLSLALELDARGVPVCVLESGGLTRDAARDLFDGATDSPIHPRDHLVESRGKRLGGTANLWEVDVGAGHPFVRYALPDEIDLESRTIRPAAWPFARGSLDTSLARAARLCGVPEDAFARPAPVSTPAEVPGELRTKLFAFGPAAVFTRDARRRLARSPTTTVALGSTAVELRLAADAGRVDSVLAATAGPAFRVRSRFVALAAGGLENARLLLLCRDLPNGHALVGRFLLDHPFVELGVLTPADPGAFEACALYDLRRTGESYSMGYLAPTPAALEREGLLNAAVLLFPRPRAYGSPGVAAARALSLRGRVDRASLRHAARAALGIRDVVDWLYQRRFTPCSAVDGSGGGWSAQPDLARRFSLFRLEGQLEQAPDPDSRVTLGRSVDALGRSRLDLRWRWSPTDEASLERLQSFLGKVVSASGFGTFRPTGGARKAFSPHHPMGTTRMHDDPQHGVVDPDCRVHGTENLYVAGSSVFPTAAGSANPTLLIVALAVRLSDHLAELL